MILIWPSAMFVQMVLVCCIFRSHRLKIDFWYEKLKKNLLVWNRKAQSLDIWYDIIASSSGTSTKFIKIMALGPKMGRPRGSQRLIKGKHEKNLLARNNMAKSLDIWYVTLSSEPLPSLFKLWPQVKTWACPGGSHVHSHQSSSCIIKCNDNKFIRGTSYCAEAGLDSCK